jgi:hypothetical protein
MVNIFLQLEMPINTGLVQFNNFFTYLQVFQCSNHNCWHFCHPKCDSEYDANIKLSRFECPSHECFSCENKEGTATRTRAGKEVRHTKR